MAEYKHGEMDVTAQTATFDGFVKFSVRFVIACIVLLVFLAIFRT
jgi:aa3 type cytochrome c oxidase subunit IV